jgi:hypothetical protein
MRNDLHRPTQVISSSLSLLERSAAIKSHQHKDIWVVGYNDGLVDLSGRDIVVAGQLNAEISDKT